MSIPSDGDFICVKVIQVVDGGMHSVGLTEEGAVYTTGVNDEAALGRKTGAALFPTSGKTLPLQDIKLAYVYLHCVT